MNKLIIKFTLSTGCVLALAFASVLAQRAVKLPPLFEKLDLTTEQRQKLEPLFAEQQKRIKEVRENATLSDEDKEARMKEIRREHNKKVNEILTAEQRTKLAELRKQQNAQAQPAKPETKKP